MSGEAVLSLLVLRVEDLQAAVRFYSQLGLTFEAEQHGSGPVHFAAEIKSTVLELYPATEKNPVNRIQLGFTLPAISPILKILHAAGTPILSELQETKWGMRAVASDPDGRRIELYQKP